MFGTRWQTCGDVRSDWGRFQSEMERVFDKLAGNHHRQCARDTYPAMNVWEDDDNVHVEAELPGIELDDLEIFVNGENQLTIKGERKQPEPADGTWHRRERSFGSFSRTVELQQDVDSSKVIAEFKQGVLTITLPKKEEVKPQRIEVKAS